MTPLLLDALVRSSAVLLAGLGAALLLRRRSAALQHWVLAATIAAAALAAPLAWIVPDWSVAAVPAPALLVFDASGAAALVVPVTAAAAALRLAAGRARSERFGPIGLAIGVLSMLVQLLRLAQIVRARAPGRRPSLAARTVDEVAARYGIRQPVDGPADGIRRFARDVGWLRPRIFVPGVAAGWSDERDSRRGLSRARARAPARLGRADRGGPGSPPLLVPTL